MNRIDLSKIHECVEFSKRKLENTCKERNAAIAQFVGSHYGENGAEKTVPTNLIELAMTIYLRLLAARSPRCMVDTEDMTLKPFAKDMETVINQLPKEIRLGDTIRRAVMEAMFSMGVVKVGIAGFDNRPNFGDEPFVSLVQMDDYFVDMSARSWDEVQYEGNEYWMSRDEIREAYGTDLPGDDYNGQSSTGVAQARSVTNAEPGGELSERVLLRDVYVVHENRMVTYAVSSMKILRDIPWDGPEGTPYIKLWFTEVPGNLLPLPPVSVWLDLHNLGNQLFRKLANQGVARKTIAMFQGGNDEEIARFRDAEDGDALRYNGAAPQEVSVGGIDNGNLAFYLQVRDLFSLLAGNLDSLGGLSPTAATATQDKLINESASARIAAMADRTVEFAKEIFERLAWYVWTDPVRERKYRRVFSKKYDIGVDKVWTPETRDGDFLDYNFDIYPFSMQDDSPTTRVQKLSEIMQQFVVPMLQQLTEQGAVIDARAVLEYVGENANMPELAEFVKFQDAPPPQPGRSAGQPQPSYVSTKAPVTKRVYERVNRPGKITERGRTAVMTQLLMGGKPQAAEADGLTQG